jgi:hypothetical protein
VADPSVVFGILGLVLLLSIHDRRAATNTA